MAFNCQTSSVKVSYARYRTLLRWPFPATLSKTMVIRKLEPPLRILQALHFQVVELEPIYSTNLHAVLITYADPVGCRSTGTYRETLT